MPSRHLVIKGKVQGVFYRATAKEKAEEIGVKGWVKNTDEGDVQALITGSLKQIEQFIEWCKQGPKRAEVTEVLLTDVKEEEWFDEFIVIR